MDRAVQMKTIEWTRTGGRTHRVTITTDEPCSPLTYMLAQAISIPPDLGFGAVNAHGSDLWMQLQLGAINCPELHRNTTVNHQCGVLWGIFGSWL